LRGDGSKGDETKVLTLGRNKGFVQGDEPKVGRKHSAPKNNKAQLNECSVHIMKYW